MPITVTAAMMVASLYEGHDAAGRVALDNAWARFRGLTMPGPRQDDELGIVDLHEVRAQLKTAIGHIEHMAAWISARQLGIAYEGTPTYSFESLGEDIAAIRAAAGAS